MNLSPHLVERARTLLNAARVAEDVVSPVGDGGDDAIRSALEACLDAPKLIPGELEKARELAADAPDEIARAAYLWQGEVAKLQIETASRVAAERLLLLDSLKSEEDYEREKQECAADTLHWFRFYAWGYDPRSPLKVQPYYPFPRQEDYIRWLDDTVIRRRTSGVVEKSRDMGATVGALDWAAHKWLFVPGFSAFLSSATEDLVDSKKDPDTLFEKVRFQLRLTPSWQLPPGFDLRRDLPYMNLFNPETQATITGGAPTENVGRQRRATVVLADEFQSWPGGGFKQSTSLSQTAYSVIKLGTPYGTLNQYYKDTQAEGANVFVMDWREHPWKSEAWYKSLPFGYVAPRMSAEEIAQEVDRSYEASQPGKVFRVWHQREPYVLITWSELVAYYRQFKLDRNFIDETGGYRVPADWNWGRMQDYGQTSTHLWCITFGARPGENYPLSDSFFVFGYVIPPTGSAVGEVQPLIEAEQRRLGLVGPPELSQMSHEQGGEDGVIQTFMDEHGEYWETWNTDYNLGIPQIQEWLMLVDQAKENPIRPQLAGRTRLYFVCADEVKLAHNPRTKEHFVTPSPSELSFKLARAEMHSYHYPPEELGKPVQLMRPEKKRGMDNFIDTLRAFATRWGPSVKLMTPGARREANLPERLRFDEVLARRGQPEYVELVSEREQALKQAELRERREREKFSRAWARAAGRPVSHRRRRRGGW